MASENTTINDKSPKGYAAFSVTCTGTNQLIGLSYNQANLVEGILRAATYRFNLQEIMCETGTQYILLKLPADHWQFDDAKLISSNYETENFTPLSFDVLPGKVTYLGRINIHIDYQEEDDFFFGKNLVPSEFSITINDESKEDFPAFLQKYKNIPIKKYHIQFVKK